MVGTVSSFMITVRKGDSFDIVFQMKADGMPMDLTDCEVKMNVKDGDFLKFTKKGEIFEPENGKFRIKLTPKETNIAVGEYKTDVQIKLKNGDIHTIYPEDVNRVAVFRVTADVTE